MKKVFTSFCVMALLVTGSALAQEAEKALEAQAVEAVEAVEAVAAEATPVEEVTPAVADVIYGSGVVLGGGCVGCEQPVQSFVPSSCCGETSFVQPVAFSQPVFQESVISQSVPASVTPIVTPAPSPVVYAQTATPGCSSCNGGATVGYPVATTYAPVPGSAAPVTSGYVPAPVVSSGCSACAEAAPVAGNNCCEQSSGRLFGSRRGLFRSGGFMQGRIASRLRGAAISEALDN